MEERDREEQEAVEYLSMDMVHSTATSDHQGLSQERVSTLVHLSKTLATQLCTSLGDSTVRIFRGTVAWCTGGWCFIDNQ